MADTITYDPSNDPQAIAEAEARDGETLAVGEQMQKDQSDLLAGKYRDAEELEKAYIELQQKMGEGQTPQTDSTPDNWEARPGKSGYVDDGSVDYDTVEEVYGENLAAVFEDANLDPWQISKHFHENNGTITPEMYQSLQDAGLPKNAVDSYLAGRASEMGYTGGADGLAQNYVNEMYNLAGGQANYDAMTDWASQNLSQEDIQAFDEVTNTGNKAAVRFAVKALVGQYEDAQGRQPELVTGRNARAGDTYQSMAQVVRDMESPQYEKDEAYRFDVMRKLERSNLKV